MKELLEPYLKMALENGAKTAEQAANFVITQSPELVKEVIMWGWVSEILAPLFGLTVILMAIYFHMKYKNSEDTEGYWDSCDGSNPPGALLNAILFIAGLLIFFGNIMDVVYPLVAPRLYLIETLSKLIK